MRNRPPSITNPIVLRGHQVETEQLRAELKEKQSLICEAATALDLIEQTQKCNQADYAAHIAELQQKIQFLELEVQTLDRGGSGGGGCSDGDATAADSSQVLSEVLARASLNSEAQQRIDELEAYVQQLEEAAAGQRRHVDETEARCSEQEELVRVAEQKFTELFVECEELRAKVSYHIHKQYIISTSIIPR